MGTHSPAVILKPAGWHTQFIFLLPSWSKSASPAPYSPAASLKPGGLQSTQGTPREYLAMLAKGAGIPHKTTTIGNEALDGPLPPAHCPDRRLKHNPCLSVKAWSFTLRNTIQVSPCLESKSSLPRNVSKEIPSSTCPWPHECTTRLPRKLLIHLSKGLIWFLPLSPRGQL